MLRHPGHRRTFRHNIRLAALLCLTAGLVNVTGFRAFQVLTTNVTGHVALFADRLAEGDIADALTVGIWMLSFFAGAFLCGFWIQRISKGKWFSYGLPILFEVGILTYVAIMGSRAKENQFTLESLAGLLLFSMGMQNAMVSVISGTVVRTTHLTGMFTDLGIELSSLGVTEKQHKKMLRQKIALRIVIIFFFFLGGITGGYLFTSWSYKTFYLPAGILIVTLLYDQFRVKFLRRIRSMRK